MLRVLSLALLLLSTSSGFAAQSIADKKASIERGGPEIDLDLSARIAEVNDDLEADRRILLELYQEANRLWQEGADAETMERLRAEVMQVRQRREAQFRDWAEQATAQRADEYALWYQPDTTLGQLIADYGEADVVYVMSPEIASLRLSVSSTLPVPFEAWGDMLDKILSYSGVGMRELSPYVKQLYIHAEDPHSVAHITDQRAELDLIPADQRVCFVLQPHPKEIASRERFLRRFVQEGRASVELVGRQIFVCGTPPMIRELLKVYDFVDSGPGNREFRLIPVVKMSAEEMAGILYTVFGLEQGGSESQREAESSSAQPPKTSPSLAITPLTTLTQSLFLMGTRDDIEAAVRIIEEIEGQVGDVKEKTLHWYQVKHSDPQELAEVLERVYTVMRGEGVEGSEAGPDQQAAPQQQEVPRDINVIRPIQGEYLRGVEQNLRVKPSVVDPGASELPSPAKDLRNFIVEPKIGAIIMIVEKEYLPRLKSLLRRLDIPKQMVEIEVLLVEQRKRLQQDYGMNLLRLGDCAENVHSGCLSWNDTASSASNKGILEFLFQREANGFWPAFDLGLKFLLTQENVIVNSAPTVTTLNQTPATIHIVEEISLSTGVVELDTSNNTSLKDAFTRAQYGITIEVTPIIHLASTDPFDQEGFDYVTMITNIYFDEEAGNSADPSRPDIIRREVSNTVRVADGESLIIGGLRAKTKTDSRDGVPFICDIPGLGKLFSTNSEIDQTVETFFFITPKIVGACDQEASRLRRCVQCERPGEGPAYFKLISEAKEQQRQRQRAMGIQRVFEQASLASVEEEAYDGRG
jgi:general secretion pathway protein D